MAIRILGGTSAAMTATNPVVVRRQLAIAIDTGVMKIGESDTTRWNDLPALYLTADQVGQLMAALEDRIEALETAGPGGGVTMGQVNDAIAAAILTHTQANNPHPQYATQSDAYAFAIIIS